MFTSAININDIDHIDSPKLLLGTFPLIVEFKRIRDFKSFASLEEIGSWIDEELKTWTSFQSSDNQIDAICRELITLQKSIVENKFLDKIIIDDAFISQSFIDRIVAYAEKQLPSIIVKRIYEQIVVKNTQQELAQFDAVFLSMHAKLAVRDPAVGAPLSVFMQTCGVPLDMVESSRQLRLDATEAVAQVKTCNNALNQHIKDTDNQLDAIRNKYITDLETGAPKKFWDERKKERHTAAKRANGFWIGSLILLFGIFYYLFDLFLDGKIIINYETLPYLLPKAVLIGSAVSLVVWFSRIKLRDKRIHEHLETDAEERVTMIKTYVAMKDNGLDDSGLSTVLGALYRPASTGLIDDSGPHLPMEFIIKNACKSVDK